MGSLNSKSPAWCARSWRTVICPCPAARTAPNTTEWRNSLLLSPGFRLFRGWLRRSEWGRAVDRKVFSFISALNILTVSWPKSERVQKDHEPLVVSHQVSVRESGARFLSSLDSPCISSTITANKRLRVSTLTPARVI
jgi:hypothetical protein